MSDRILGVVCVIAAAAMAWFAQSYAPAFSYEPVGPRAFPRVLAALMAIAGLWLAFKPNQDGSPFRVADLKPIGLCALTVVIYAALFQTLGFTIATTVMAVPVGMAFGGSWKQSLVGGLALGLGFYLLFDKLLDVVLPTGLLQFAFGGR